MPLGNKAMIAGEPVLPGTDGTIKDWVLFLLPLFAFSFSMAMIYSAMRGVMDLGGFVATGGPYEIAHPAPGWVWVFPVFINVMVISMISAAALGKRINGPNLMSLSWSALFISLGWNFTEYGIGASKNTGPVISWLICAFLFMAMGIIPLFFIIRHFIRDLNNRNDYPEAITWKGKVILQALTACAGIYLGAVFFAAL